MTVKKKLTRFEVRLLLRQIQRVRDLEIQKEAARLADEFIRTSIREKMESETPIITATHRAIVDGKFFNRLITFFKKKMGR